MDLRALGLATLVAACSSTTAKAPAPAHSDLALTNQIDLLFVIDDSSSTGDLQTVFAMNFPSLVSAIDALPGGRPDLHIGVVTTSIDFGVQGLGTGCPSPSPNNNGLLINAPRVAAGCMPQSGRFISDVASGGTGRTTNYSGNLADVFSCIAQVGANGCGFEAPLEAMKRALDGTRPENAGFLRDGAALVVIVFTDEDDCSVADPALFALGSDVAGPGDFRCTPLYAYTCDRPISVTDPGTYTNCVPRTNTYLHDLSTYTDFLANLRPAGAARLATIDGGKSSTISTVPVTSPFTTSVTLGPACHMTINGNATAANPAIRLATLSGNLGTSGRDYSICQSDYSAALVDIAELAGDSVTGCIEGNVTGDCTAEDVSAGVHTPLVACTLTAGGTVDPGSPKPCFWAAPDLATCHTATQQRIHVERASAPPPDTLTSVSCLLAN